MVRYNAAHRGAEREVFPVTDALGLPVIAYTALRWGLLAGGLGRPTRVRRCRRHRRRIAWVLQNPSTRRWPLMAPHDRAELDDDLTVLAARGPMSAAKHERLAAHGGRVRRHAGGFP